MHGTAAQSPAISVAVVIGGGPIDPLVDVGALGPFDAVVAADSGYDTACAIGLPPTHLVGDLDSISAAGLADATAAGVPVDDHDRDKDATDTTLALHLAAALGARRVTLLGPATSARPDHVLGAVAALGDPALGGCEAVSASLTGAWLHVLHAGREVRFELGRRRVFSLLALHGDCAGVHVAGARWPLVDARLAAASTLGISNEGLGGDVRVAVREGVLTVVVPVAAATTDDDLGGVGR